MRASVKYAQSEGEDFTNELASEMNRYFAEQEPVASLETKEPALASLANTLVKCANFLEEQGHPLARRADGILLMIARSV